MTKEEVQEVIALKQEEMPFDVKAQGKGVERGVEWGDTSFDASIFATNPTLFNR